MSVTIWPAKFWEDGSCTCVSRVCMGDATGAATGTEGEGKWVKRADLTSITRYVYDLSSSTPGTAILTTTLTVSTVIEDTPVTNRQIATFDYNFHDNVPKTAFPDGGRTYRIEYVFRPTSGADYEFPVVFQGEAEALRTS